MRLHLRTDASNAVKLEREIIFHGISKFYVQPYQNVQVEFVFLALSEFQLKLLTHVIRKYNYSLTIAV